MPNEVDIRDGLHGCGNHACLIHKPQGQGTNGPCTCIERNNIEVRMLINRADQEIARLSALLHEREEEIRRLREALTQIANSEDGSTPSAYFDHTYDDCEECAKKNAIACAALRGEQS